MAVAKKISEFGVCAFPLGSNGFRAISVRPAHREDRLRSTSELRAGDRFTTGAALGLGAP